MAETIEDEIDSPLSKNISKKILITERNTVQDTIKDKPIEAKKTDRKGNLL